MIPRVASTCCSLVAEEHLDRLIREFEARPTVRSKVALVLIRSAVALVLLAFPVIVLRAQEPQQWPQDDDTYADQQPAYQQPQYDSQNGQAQPYPQQGYGYPQSNQ